MKSYYLIVLNIVLLFLTSCQSAKPTNKNFDLYYNSAGVQQYLLADLPEWINFSSDAGCFREKSNRYLNLDAMMKSFSLSYVDVLQIQAGFSHDYLNQREESKRVLSIKEEEVVFFNARDRVSNNIKFFDAPTFKKVHLIWLDEVLGDEAKEKKLASFIDSAINDDGVPVLISNCLSRKEIELKYAHLGTKFISSELFSIYQKDGQRHAGLILEVGEFFKPEQEIILYKQNKEKVLNEIKGNYKVQNY